MVLVDGILFVKQAITFEEKSQVASHTIQERIIGFTLREIIMAIEILHAIHTRNNNFICQWDCRRGFSIKERAGAAALIAYKRLWNLIRLRKKMQKCRFINKSRKSFHYYPLPLHSFFSFHKYH